MSCIRNFDVIHRDMSFLLQSQIIPDVYIWKLQESWSERPE